jgi:hypothetical protein
MYSRVRIGKNLSDMFPTRNGLKQGDTLPPLPFNLALENTIRWIQVNQYDLKLHCAHWPLVYAADVNISGESVQTIEKNTEALIVASKEHGLDINV